ncbi:MAG: hypothetical protein ACKVUS_14600 [Saprospiraceae bacterium]
MRFSKRIVGQAVVMTSLKSGSKWQVAIFNTCAQTGPNLALATWHLLLLNFVVNKPTFARLLADIDHEETNVPCTPRLRFPLALWH